MSGPTNLPVCLTIAGSDSSGGAGIQADLRTFSCFSTYGMSVVTAVTAQTPQDVRDVFPVPPKTVAAQLIAALESAQVSAVKIGMVHSIDTLQALTPILQAYTGPVVMDPVLAAGCGGQLNQVLPRNNLLDFLSACATVVTPNIPEAEYLLDATLSSHGDMTAAAEELHKRCNVNVFLKGGHAAEPGEQSVDIIVSSAGMIRLSAPPLEPLASHGTGCTLSAALAAKLAHGCQFPEAAVAAKAFVWQSLNNCQTLNDEYAAMRPPESLDVSMISCKPIHTTPADGP